MISNAKFQSDKNNKASMPPEKTGLPFVVAKKQIIENNIPWHWHPEFEFIYVADGEIEMHTADDLIILRKGDAVFINSGVMHAYRSVSGQKSFVYVNVFDVDFLCGTFKNLLEQKYLYPILKCDKLSTYCIRPDNYAHVVIMKHILNIIKLATEESFGYEFEIHTEFNRLWCAFFKETQHLHNNSSIQNNTDTQRIKSMIQFIHDNYMERINLKKIADVANISTRECTRCFQRCINDTPINYLNNYRIKIATQLLVQTDENILTISENCGFSSNSYFGKVFHELLGCTPFEYRKKKHNS